MNPARLFVTLGIITVLSLGVPVVDAADFVSVKVAKGDTLSALCRKHLVAQANCSEIAGLNRLRNPNLILVGQELLFPRKVQSIPIEGIVTYVKGTVLYTEKQGGNSRTVTVNDSLKEGGRIKTDKESVTEVTYSDGTSFLVRPNSSVDLLQTRRQGETHYIKELFLQTGEIINKIKRATGREQRYNIQTPSAVAGARGTEFRVAVDPQEATRSEVLEGSVSLAAMKQEVPLQMGEGTLARKGEPPQPPRKLLAAPAAVDLQKIYKSAPVSIRFSPVDNAKEFRILLAGDQAMKDVIREAVIPPADAVTFAGVTDGTYFLHSFSVDNLGLVGLPSEPVPVTVRCNPLPPFIQAPLANGEFRQRNVVFQWLKVGDATDYRLQISGNREFSGAVTEVRTSGELTYTAQNLPFGTSYFRIASVAADGYEGIWSDVLGVSIVMPPATPELARPEAGDEKVRIRVRDAGAGMSYHYQVARDDVFTSLLLDETMTRPEVEFPSPVAPGNYFVRSKAIDAAGYEGDFSPAQSFRIEPKFPYGPVGVGLGIAGIILMLIL